MSHLVYIMAMFALFNGFCWVIMMHYVKIMEKKCNSTENILFNFQQLFSSGLILICVMAFLNVATFSALLGVAPRAACVKGIEVPLGYVLGKNITIIQGMK